MYIILITHFSLTIKPYLYCNFAIIHKPFIQRRNTICHSIVETEAHRHNVHKKNPWFALGGTFNQKSIK